MITITIVIKTEGEKVNCVTYAEGAVPLSPGEAQVFDLMSKAITLGRDALQQMNPGTLMITGPGVDQTCADYIRKAKGGGQ